jgi:ubiquinone/menaquinone biosynthesis C-methylase UbiE
MFRESLSVIVGRAEHMGDHIFAASIAELYDSILGPFMFEPFARETAARLDRFDGDLLEVAAGTGILTRELDRALGAAARITATDLNPPMLEVAAARSSAPRVTWRQADALDLPFTDRSFDAVVCQFGVMFYPDQARGHAEAGRVLRPGGRYVLSVWDDLASNPVAETIHEAVAASFPDDPPWFFARTPHGHHDKAKLCADLADAGFREIAVETLRLEAGRIGARDLARGFCQGTPLRAEIEARDAEGLVRVTAAAELALRRRFGDATIASPIQAHVLTARR